MTQPPQQPGPDGQQPDYRQQPGQAPQQGGGYPQQGGMQQPGDAFPSAGAQAADTGFGQPGGYPEQPTSQKKKSPLPWILVGGGVLVVAAVVILIIALTGGDDKASAGSARSVAETAVKALNAKDQNAAKQVDCNHDNSTDSLGDLNDVQIQASLVGETKENGETATQGIKLTATQDGQSQDFTGELKMKKQDGNWCVDDLSEADDPDDPGTSGGTDNGDGTDSGDTTDGAGTDSGESTDSGEGAESGDNG